MRVSELSDGQAAEALRRVAGQWFLKETAAATAAERARAEADLEEIDNTPGFLARIALGFLLKSLHQDVVRWTEQAIAAAGAAPFPASARAVAEPPGAPLFGGFVLAAREGGEAFYGQIPPELHEALRAGEQALGPGSSAG